MAIRKLRLALLICDTPILPIREKHGTYLEIYTTYLHKSLLATDRTTTIEFTLEGYNVVEGNYPKNEELTGDNAFDGIIITGSAASAYERTPWILTLIDYVARVIKEAPNIRIVGICFGHQIIAIATGGECVRNDKGWEVGTTTVELSETGRQIFGVDTTHLEIQEVHRDHVPALPPPMELLASSSATPVEGMVSRYPSGEIHVFTVQGHPEFTPDIVHTIIDVRGASGVMNAETVKEGRVKASKRDDGVGLIGKAIWQILGPTDADGKIV